MKVVLDANVLIAAFATRGFCQSVFELCVAPHEIVLSDGILDEAEHNLRTKMKLPETKVQSVLAYLREYTQITNPKEIAIPECRDPKDVKILGVAVGSQARALVTGDHDLLILKKIGSTPIYSPRQFWEKVRRRI